jgi:creatinine amidohydrolase
MPLLRLAEMTWTEVRDLDRSRAIAILPVGATEAHGPHLPLDTDGIIAAAMAEAGAERLAAAGYLPLLLPGLPYTAAPFAAAFPGTVAVRGETVTALVVDVARALAGQAIPVLALANAHLDPAHTASLDAAVAAIRDQGLLTAVFPDVTRKPWALRLGEEFRSGACHAGRYEASIVLATRPALVREEVRRALPPNPASLSVAIREGKRSFAAAGGPEAYFGAPAAATRAEGEATIATLGRILAEAVLAAVGGGALGASRARP